MTDFVVTARKWRPLKFEDVVGQEHVTTTLRNAIKSDRLAHAYLFSGPRGVGKTTTARLLAKIVNCLSPVDLNPDNECEICMEITEGRSFNVLEIDGASNRGVEEIRSLREAVRFAPPKGKYKAYIIDEVHMLTKEAFNALLKTLEEPPKHVLFIFATTEIHKVPATILSRCQRFDFRRISVKEIIGNLQVIAQADGVTFEEEALMLIAQKADGSLRDAQSLFDQIISLCGKNVTHDQIRRELRIVDLDTFFQVGEAISGQDGKRVLEIIDTIVTQGYDLKEFLDGLSEHLRNMLIVNNTGTTDLIEAPDSVRKRYETESKLFSIADLLRLQRIIAGTIDSMRWVSQPRFRLEADLVQMTQVSSAESVGELLGRLDELKKKVPEQTATAPPRERGNSDIRPRTGIPQGEPPEPSKAVSEQEIRARWPEFVDAFKEKRISLGLTLEAAKIVDVQGSTVKLGCEDEFAVSSIRRYKRELQETYRTLLNGSVQLEPELVLPVAGGGPKQGEGKNQPQSKPLDDHPVVKALIRELGAEPL